MLVNINNSQNVAHDKSQETGASNNIIPSVEPSPTAWDSPVCSSTRITLSLALNQRTDPWEPANGVES